MKHTCLSEISHLCWKWKEVENAWKWYSVKEGNRWRKNSVAPIAPVESGHELDEIDWIIQQNKENFRKAWK